MFWSKLTQTYKYNKTKYIENMSKRKHIQIKKNTYEQLKECKQYNTEPLTNVLERLIEKYGGLV